MRRGACGGELGVYFVIARPLSLAAGFGLTPLVFGGFAVLADGCFLTVEVFVTALAVGHVVAAEEASVTFGGQRFGGLSAKSRATSPRGSALGTDGHSVVSSRGN